MKLTIRTIKTIKIDPDRDVYIWDDELAGFGARFKPSGIISFFIQYRNAHGTSRRLTLGKMGVLTPEEARTEARLKLADVAKGIDPAGERKADREAMTIKELCFLYMDTVKKLPGPRGRIKKPSTIKADQSRIDKHIIPLIGNKPVVSLTLRDVEKLQANIAAGKTAQSRPEKGRSGVVAGGHVAAARTIGLFSTMLEFARRQGIISSNPAKGVKKFPDQKRNRFLSQDEIKALGASMRQGAAEGENKTGIAAIQVLLLTGCRRNEILSLPWAWLDEKARCIRFADTKSGAQIRPIGGEAIKLLLRQPKREIIGKDKKKKPCPWIFSADRGEGHFVGLPNVLARLCARAALNGVTLHTLRHTFASVAAELGYTELTIAGLLGHAARGVTNRYSHLPDSALLSAADRVAAYIAATLDDKNESAEVVLLSKRREGNSK